MLLTLSRARLETFLICQRRFQLRYLDELPWPAAPVSPAQAAARQEGELFHQLVAHHYLGLDPSAVAAGDLPQPVRGWWENFQRTAPQPAPAARLFPELTLSVPVGDFLLTGRFDLVILDEAGGRIFDWKTGWPLPAEQLADDWQTRLYLALLVEGRAALGAPWLSADRVQMTYWYARQPDAAVKIAYSEEKHRRRWGEIERLLADLAARRAIPGPWPLTTDLTQCSTCAYQTYCGRFDAPAAVDGGWPEDEQIEEEAAAEQLWTDVAGMEPASA